jgi:hypothetical protein
LRTNPDGSKKKMDGPTRKKLSPQDFECMIQKMEWKQLYVFWTAFKEIEDKCDDAADSFLIAFHEYK